MGGQSGRSLTARRISTSQEHVIGWDRGFLLFPGILLHHRHLRIPGVFGSKKLQTPDEKGQL